MKGHMGSRGGAQEEEALPRKGSVRGASSQEEGAV